MLNPAHLAVFATVVKSGSISAAALQLGCGKSVVSRQLAQLEDQLGARLLQRSTRRMALTEIGQMVLQEAQQIELALHNIDHLSEQFQQEVCGQLRVSCSMAGRQKLVPIIAAFMIQYPKIRVNLQLEDQIVDLIASQTDVAIRSAPMADSSLIARKLTDNHNLIVAAPDYLRALVSHSTQMISIPTPAWCMRKVPGRGISGISADQADHIKLQSITHFKLMMAVHWSTQL